MSRLEELLFKFQDGVASPDELREWEALLERPEARAALVDGFFMSSAIRGHFRAAPEGKAVPRGRVVRTRRLPTQGPSRTWAWVAAGILAAAFAMLLTSSPKESPKPTARIQTPPVPVLEKPALPKPEPGPDLRPVPVPVPREEPRPVEPPQRPTPPQEPPAPEPKPAKSETPPETKPAPDPPPPQRSQVVGVARIEKVEGVAFVAAKEGKSPAVAGTEYAVGQGLETGAGSRIVLAFPDKTRLELGPDSALTDVTVDAGTRLALALGTVRADAASQPKNKPLMFATPHAEAKVLGTELRLVVDRDPKKGTLLEVEKGKVELKRLSDRKTVVVGAGQFAIAAAGTDLKAMPLPPIPLAKFAFDDGKTGSEWVGAAEAGPARPGNRGCLKGLYLPQERLTRVMLSDDANGLFIHREGAVLTFDYWADGETSILSIYVWDRTQQLSIGSYENRSLTRRQWTRATLPLSLLHEGGRGLQEGDFIKNLTIQTNQGNCVLFVDNVEIAVPRPK